MTASAPAVAECVTTLYASLLWGDTTHDQTWPRWRRARFDEMARTWFHRPWSTEAVQRALHGPLPLSDDDRLSQRQRYPASLYDDVRALRDSEHERARQRIDERTVPLGGGGGTTVPLGMDARTVAAARARRAAEEAQLSARLRAAQVRRHELLARERSGVGAVATVADVNRRLVRSVAWIDFANTWHALLCLPLRLALRVRTRKFYAGVTGGGDTAAALGHHVRTVSVTVYPFGLDAQGFVVQPTMLTAFERQLVGVLLAAQVATGGAVFRRVHSVSSEITEFSDFTGDAVVRRAIAARHSRVHLLRSMCDVMLPVHRMYGHQRGVFASWLAEVALCVVARTPRRYRVTAREWRELYAYIDEVRAPDADQPLWTAWMIVNEEARRLRRRKKQRQQ